MRTSALFALLAALWPGQTRADDWKIAREYRRPIEKSPPAETAVFSFRGGGHVHAEGQDVLVTDADGQTVPSEVLMSRNGDEVWVAYRAVQGKSPHLVYFGGQRTGASPPTRWDPKVSVLLTTFPIPAGALENYRAIASAAHRSRIYGLGIVPNIALAYNPFGPDDNFASAFTGYIKIDKPGKYRIFTASDEASFVLLDGRPLCAWPGRHAADEGRTGKFGDDVELSAGEHRIEYYHAEVDGPQAMTLGWIRPGSKSYEVIPPAVFLQTPTTQTGPAQRRNNEPLAAFDWSRTDTLCHEEFMYSRIRFANQSANVPENGRLVWDYGDGFRAEGAGGDHVYFGEGQFTCKLQLLDEKGKVINAFESTIWIGPSRGNLTIQHTRQTAEYLQVIGTYDFSKAQRPLLHACWALAEPQEDPALIRPITEAYVKEFGHRNEHWYVADRLAQAYAISQPAKAVELYGRLVTGAPTPFDGARAQVEQIETMIYKLQEYEKTFTLIKELRKSRDEQIAQIGAAKLGDIYRARGDFKKAEEAYREAQQAAYKDMDPREVAVREGGYLETASSYIDTGYLRAAREILLKWGADFPTGNLRGDLILLTAKYFQALGDHQRAIDELTTLTKINPLTPYLPEIEFRMARAHAALGDKAKAEELREKVIREYPNSRIAEEAKRTKF